MDKKLAKDAAIIIRSLMRDLQISDHIVGVIGGKYVSSNDILKRLDGASES